MDNATKHHFAVFGLLFGAVVWGIIWYPYRLLEAAGLSGVASSLATYSIALGLGAAIFAGNWRSLFHTPRIVLVLAVAAGWANLSYVLAVIDGEVMRVLLLFYLSPLWTLLLAKLLLKEQPGLRGLMVIALSLTGAFIMLWQDSNAVPMPQNRAEWLGLSSGFSFALTNVLTRRASHLSLQAKSFAVWLGVALGALLLLPFDTAPIPLLSLNLWLLVAGIGVLLAVSTLLVQFGVTQMPANRSSVIFLFELVVAAIASYLLAGEVLTLREWVGGAMIVVASISAANVGEKSAP